MLARKKRQRGEQLRAFEKQAVSSKQEEPAAGLAQPAAANDRQQAMRNALVNPQSKSFKIAFYRKVRFYTGEAVQARLLEDGAAEAIRSGSFSDCGGGIV